MTSVAWRMVALAAALFTYLTAEMFPVGVLPVLASDLHTTESGAGRLLTVYAVIAGVAILPTVAVTRYVDRRVVLVGSLVVLAISQVGLAVAPNLPTALAARAIAALPHGLLWSTVPIVAVSLVPPARQGRATAQVFVGGSAALVGGAPLMTGLASWIGWRPAAAALGAAALVLAALLWLVMPRALHGEDAPDVMPTSREWLPGVMKICGITALVVTSTYIPYTFLAVMAQQYGFRSWSLGALQIAFGAAGLLAVAFIGRLIDRGPTAAVVLTVAGLAIGFGVVALAPNTAAFVIGVLLWGAAMACVAPTMQTAALRSAPGAAVTASALYVLAFQIGISTGSLLGGVVLDGPGLRWLPVCAVAGLIPVAAVPLFGRRVRAGRTLPPCTST
ncbi:MAG: MFS transporter [Mycobacterium sp.]|nr:MFS transporter [Mycobacterium sp.]